MKRELDRKYRIKLAIKVFSITSVILIILNYLALGFTELAKLWFDLPSIGKVIVIFVIAGTTTWYLCKSATFWAIISEYFKKDEDIPENIDYKHK